MPSTPKNWSKGLGLALCAMLALTACSTAEPAMPQDDTHKIAAEGTASPSLAPSGDPEQMTTAQVATTAGAVMASELGFPSSAKIQGKDLQALAEKPTGTLKDIVVLPSQCSAPIEDLNWSPVQLGTEAARTDFTNQSQSITGSVEVAKLGKDSVAKFQAHNANVERILADCQSVKLNALDYRETLKFSDPGVPQMDSALYYTRDGDYAQDSLVLIKRTEQYAVMVSFVSATSLQDPTFNKVASNILDAVLAQLP